MAYIGRPFNTGNLAVQSGTGDGSDTTPIATLDYTTTTNGIAVYLDGVRQLAGTDYTVSGTTLTFTTAPPDGVGIDVYFLGLELSIPTPADGSVGTAKIVNNAVDETKLKDALIGDFTDATVTASDTFLHGDASDSGNTKRDTIQGVLDLVATDVIGASGHRTAGNQSINSGTLTKVQFDAESYDPNSDFDFTTNEEYVAPVAGKYLICANVSIGGLGDGKYFEVHVYINGASKAFTRHGNGALSATVIANIACIKNLSASDTVQVWVRHDHGSARDIWSVAEDRIFLHCQRIAL